ncbi:MAG: glycosyltransferase [Flavobacteriaceae bacterium]|nr:glycosyltransferase [Flavobacteriaceae bacterium]
MQPLSFSFIIPVYNRPEEIKELLDSFLGVKGIEDYEIVIVEDGSSKPSKAVTDACRDQLSISYYQKENTGPGDSRNFGMQKAKGNYFIILDSDCLLPPDYLTSVKNSLEANYVDCYGGPDAAHKSFSNLQKAIDFSMTSIITTGGIRGGKQQVDEFQPRSFNMGLSKAAFEATGGFGDIHPGEDPDLSIRLKKLGFKTTLIPEAFVYHKRRISWSKFYKQVNKFGMTRPILNSWHPESRKLTYWFPTIFILLLIAAVIGFVFGRPVPLLLYAIYFIVAFIMALLKTNFVSALMVIPAILIQFFGYGWGFLKSTLLLKLSRKTPQQLFPNLFFSNQ